MGAGESGSPVEEVSVIIRCRSRGAAAPRRSVWSRRSATDLHGRIPRGDIGTFARARCAQPQGGKPVTLPSSLKTTDPGRPGRSRSTNLDHDETVRVRPAFRPAEIGEDGRGVVVGICDWGFDFTHAELPQRRRDDTRLHRLWDQRGSGDPPAPAPYNHGRLLTREAINAALAEPDPCAALGYHPAERRSHRHRLARNARRRHPRRQPARAGLAGRARVGSRTSCSSTWRRRSSRSSAISAIRSACSKGWTSSAGRRRAARACCT